MGALIFSISRQSLSNIAMNLIISPAGRGHFRVRLGDRTIATSTETPFFSAARVLQAEGVPPQTPLTMSWEGDEDQVCLSSTVGAAARLTVSEDARGTRFAPYRGKGI